MQLWIQSIGCTHYKHRIASLLKPGHTQRTQVPRHKTRYIASPGRPLQDKAGAARRQRACLVPLECGTRNMASPGSRDLCGCALAAPCTRLPPRSTLTSSWLPVQVGGAALFDKPLGHFCFCEVPQTIARWALQPDLLDSGPGSFAHSRGGGEHLI